MLQLRRNPPKYPFRIHPPTEVGGFLRRRVIFAPKKRGVEKILNPIMLLLPSKTSI
jgi:hypothetical protein